MFLSDIIPSHAIAQSIADAIDSTLTFLHLQADDRLREFLYITVVVALALCLGRLLRIIVLVALRRWIRIHDTVGARALLRHHTIARCTHIVTPLTILALIPFAISDTSDRLITLFERAAWIYTLIAAGIGICAVMTFSFDRYNDRDNTRNLPLKGTLNIAKGATWIIIGILAVAVALDRSPTALLTGLGALSAALMLIFKDSILGFVAGLQMSQNDMLHVGDWIKVPGTAADGTVLDVSLSTVKVLNFDLTIVTVPPYTLVSQTFQNYRNMSQSGTRRMMMYLLVDIPSITPVDDSHIKAITERLPLLKTFTDTLAGATARYDTGLRPVNGTVETNLGLFRAYITLYLTRSEMISQQQQILVNLLQPTGTGAPLRIYCFTATSDWNSYEAICSTVLEHLIAVAPIFGLVIYSSGTVDTTVTLQGSAIGRNER